MSYLELSLTCALEFVLPSVTPVKCYVGVEKSKLFQFLVSKLEFSLVGICVRVALTCVSSPTNLHLQAVSGAKIFFFKLVN